MLLLSSRDDNFYLHGGYQKRWLKDKGLLIDVEPDDVSYL